MKKIITFLAVIIISLFCLCACGTESGETTTDAGHIHAYGEWQTVREADCVNVGERERTCSCGETETEEISALGHTGGTADCKTLAKCERCGEEYGDYGPHIGGEAKTCKERAKCERCGVTYGDYGPHTGGEATCKRRARCEVCMHPYGEVDPENHRIIAATCVSKEKCRDCKKELGDSFDPNNHGVAKGKGIDKICEKCHKSVLPETDASIVDSTNEKPIDFNEYLKKVNDERNGRLSTPYDGNEPNYTRLDKNKLLTAEEREKYVSADMPKRNGAMMTKEQALADAEICFKAFYTYYSLYEYFGADKFEEAERKAIAAINAYYEEDDMPMTDGDFYDIMLSSLDFIIDSHASLSCSSRGGSFTNLNKKNYYAYYVKDIVFREDDIGYYTLVQGKKWYLEKVNGGDFSEYLKVTIDESGELVYALVRIANPDAESLEGDTFTIQRGNVAYIHNILWSKYDTRQSTGETTAGVRIENGVPIIHTRSFDRGRYDAELLKYAGTGSQLKNQKLFVIDLRGNGGGSSRYTMSWLKGYSGATYPGYPFMSARLNARLSGSSINGWMESYVPKENPNNTIVLIDKHVCSSGELAYQYHSTFNNTLFVGTNTNGCMLAGECVYVQLPNSKMVFRIGTLYIDSCKEYYKGMNPEGIGLMPDVFVNSTEAFDLSMKMIEYYGIEKSKNTSGITTFGTGKR